MSPRIKHADLEFGDATMAATTGADWILATDADCDEFGAEYEDDGSDPARLDAVFDAYYGDRGIAA